MSSLKINNVLLKDGSTIEFDQLNIIVGPNNVGKTAFLKDVASWVSNPNKHTTILIDKVDYDIANILAQPNRFFDITDDPVNVGNYYIRAPRSDLKGHENIRIIKSQYDGWLSKNVGEFDDATKLQFTISLGKFFVTILDAESRLLITKRTPTHDPEKNPPSNLLQAFYSSPDSNRIQKELEAAFEDTFQKNLIFDYSALQQICFRVGKDQVDLPLEPRDLRLALKSGSFKPLDEEGDGFRSFVGAVLSTLTAEPRVLLLDEPEAFLHPLQAENLGRLIAKISKDKDQQVFVSTHSAPFLWGALKENPNANIIRLNRDGDETSVLKIEKDTIQKLFQKPIFSSQRVLESIFFNGVIVCEGDSDRAVYDYAVTKNFGATDVLVTHAHNKQSGRQVVEYIQQLGTKCVGIFDIDLINDHDEFSRHLDAFEMGAVKQGLLTIRKSLSDVVDEQGVMVSVAEVESITNKMFESSKQGEIERSNVRKASKDLRGLSRGWERVKKEGEGFWEGEHLENFRKLRSTCADAGLFIVPKGELENWFILDVRKQKFVEKAMEEIDKGNTPADLKEFLQAALSHFKQ